jgi:hypothetical protein
MKKILLISLAILFSLCSSLNAFTQSEIDGCKQKAENNFWVKRKLEKYKKLYIEYEKKEEISKVTQDIEFFADVIPNQAYREYKEEYKEKLTDCLKDLQREK